MKRCGILADHKIYVKMVENLGAANDGLFSFSCRVRHFYIYKSF